jgi:hypothetical protein
MCEAHLVGRAIDGLALELQRHVVRGQLGVVAATGAGPAECQ